MNLISLLFYLFIDLFKVLYLGLFIQLAFSWSTYQTGRVKKASLTKVFQLLLAVGWSTLVLLHVPSHPPEGSTSSYMTFSRQQKQTIKAQCQKLHNVTSTSFSWSSKLHSQSKFKREVNSFYIWTERAVLTFSKNSLGPIQSLTLTQESLKTLFYSKQCGCKIQLLTQGFIAWWSF